MKVGMVTASVSRKGGGIQEVVRRSALELHHRGSNVSVFGLGDDHLHEDHESWCPVAVSVFQPRGYKPFGYAPDLLPALRSAAPDVLHNHGLWMYPSVASVRWSRLTHRPYLVSVHGMLDPWAVTHSYWKKKFASMMYERRHLTQAACLHALCSAEADAIRRYGLPNPLCVIPFGIDLPSLSFEGSARHEKALLFLGRLHPKKGLMNLLMAWQQLQHDCVSEAAAWELWIAGWDQGNHEQALRKYSLEHDLGSSVRFLGPKFGEEKDRLLRSVGAFVLPSFSEGLPVSVLEAWAYGLPVAMTKECNLPQGFSSSAAICIDTTAPGIARGLLDLMALSSEDRIAMGMCGRQLVKQQFSWSSYADHMSSVYAWMSGAGPRPSCVSTP
ncbi:MAG: glycosyltransferase [Nitrospira sp.]|nr:glycosyltransferase [Nitrospira sp.]MDR4468513.1 glycosyltransferase [Nitrospira sp.]